MLNKYFAHINFTEICLYLISEITYLTCLLGELRKQNENPPVFQDLQNQAGATGECGNIVRQMNQKCLPTTGQGLN